MKIATFLRKNADLPKRVVDFPVERDTFRNKIMEIVEDFDEKSYNNNGKPWKSSRILHVNPNFCIVLSFSSFVYIFSFFFIFHFLSFSFNFCHFLSFSFIFFHFLSFSLSLLGAQNLIFFGPQFRYDFSSHFLKKKKTCCCCCVDVVVVVVVSDAAIEEQCSCRQSPGKLCKGAHDGKELFTTEGSKNWRSTPEQHGGARKMAKKGRKTPSWPPS